MARQFWTSLKKYPLLISPGVLSRSVIYGSNAIGLAYFTKHSLFLSYYRDYTQSCGQYGPNEPDEKLNSMLQEVLSKDLKKLASENTPLELYHTSGLDTSNMGTIGTIFGAVVGVPVFYEFNDKKDVEEYILVNSIKSDASGGQEVEVCDCFILSDNAKKYGIAREVLLINTFKVYINALLPIVVSFVMYFIWEGLREGYAILKRPVYIRVFSYTVLAVFGLMFWRFFYKNVLYYYESEVEADLVNLGNEYIEGGVEYCTKALQRESLSAKMKNERFRILHFIDEFISKLVVPSGTPLQKRLAYFKFHLEGNKKSEE